MVDCQMKAAGCRLSACHRLPKVKTAVIRCGGFSCITTLVIETAATAERDIPSFAFARFRDEEMLLEVRSVGTY